MSNLGRHADAQLALGDLYFKGQGVPHGYAEALSWYRKSALLGHPVAQYRLGAMYAEGYAGGLNAVEAYKWFTLAMKGKNQIIAYDSRFNPEAALSRLAAGMNRNQIKLAREAAEIFLPQ